MKYEKTELWMQYLTTKGHEQRRARNLITLFLLTLVGLAVLIYSALRVYYLIYIPDHTRMEALLLLGMLGGLIATFVGGIFLLDCYQRFPEQAKQEITCLADALGHSATSEWFATRTPSTVRAMGEGLMRGEAMRIDHLQKGLAETKHLKGLSYEMFGILQLGVASHQGLHRDKIDVAYNALLRFGLVEPGGYGRYFPEKEGEK